MLASFPKVPTAEDVASEFPKALKIGVFDYPTVV